ncbi:hypothetical protein [Bordetella sp. BOR01]|nr:hypothetical protein [Bordetella sp. BOR01]
MCGPFVFPAVGLALLFIYINLAFQI